MTRALFTLACAALACGASVPVRAASLSLEERVAEFTLGAVDITLTDSLDLDLEPGLGNDDGGYDVDLEPCSGPLCEQGHEWEVIQGNPKQLVIDPATVEGFGERMVHSNNLHLNRTYEEGYSAIVEFGGYSGTQLCTRYTRRAPIAGHTECPLKRDWYHMWKTQAADVGKNSPCYVDDMRAYQSGNKLSSPDGTEIRMGNCPKPGTDPDDKWHGGYDWRYGSIRPQDNPSMALYPQVAQHIEEKVIATGKKVVVRGCSGGTINGYAFLMSQTKKWRDDNVLAFVAVSPVFGGTVSSLHSVLAGWKAGAMDICTGRAAALFVPSVYWMWPHPGVAPGQWNSSEVIVVTPSKNYTAADFDVMLQDMGCGKGPKNLYDLEKEDLLQTFPPPLVDTYVFYGYGLATQAGFDMGRDFDPEKDGENKCPPKGDKAFVREWDNGDVTAPLRSCQRAMVWEAAHTKADKVLHNVGYKGMSHGCNCNSKQCKADYACILDKLAGKPHPGC